MIIVRNVPTEAVGLALVYGTEWRQSSAKFEDPSTSADSMSIEAPQSSTELGRGFP